MRKDPFSKLQSSLSLEDLLAQPSDRNSKNWLLTYLDVFVLVIMLVITMLTLSDIKSEQETVIKSKKKLAVVCPPVAPPVVVTCPPPLVAENPPMLQIAPIAPKENSAPPIPAIAPEIKNATENGTNTIIKPIETMPATKNTLQQQLINTIDESKLNKLVNIKITQGYTELEIQDNVLFKSSEAELTASGKALIKRLTPLLKKSVGLILIEGHTDNIPIKTPHFPSNWELGAARATSVLHFLVSEQLESNRLRAISYADTMPTADNSTATGREKNRRVNILIKFSEQ